MADFQTCFNDADQVYVAPVYAAGEEPVDGVDSDALVAGIKSRGHRFAQAVTDQNDLAGRLAGDLSAGDHIVRSEEHTSELQSLMRISYAVFCLKKKKKPILTNKQN